MSCMDKRISFSPPTKSVPLSEKTFFGTPRLATQGRNALINELVSRQSSFSKWTTCVTMHDIIHPYHFISDRPRFTKYGPNASISTNIKCGSFGNNHSMGKSAHNACFSNLLHCGGGLDYQIPSLQQACCPFYTHMRRIVDLKKLQLWQWLWGIKMGCNLPSSYWLNLPSTRIIPWSSRYGLNEISELDELTDFPQTNFATLFGYSRSWQCLIRICSACCISFPDNRSWLGQMCLRTFNNLRKHASALFILYHNE